jgi:hypothetical protein
LSDTIDSCRRYKLQRQLAVAATRDSALKLLFVGGENLDTFPSSRDCDIPLLRIGSGPNRRVAEQDMINRLALRTVRSDGIPANKLPIICWQDSAVLKSDLSGTMNFANGNNFTVGEQFSPDGFSVRL